MTAAPYLLIVIVSVIVGASLLTTLLTTINAQNQDVRASTSFAAVEPQYQLRPCGCKNDWMLCTNERTRVDTVFAPQTQPIPSALNKSALLAFMGEFVEHEILRVQPSVNAADTCTITGVNSTLNVTRNTYRLNAQSGCRESINLHTPFIDGTLLYGDSLSEAGLLVGLRDGPLCELRMSAGNLLPTAGGLFVAGDPRATTHAVLASIHTLFAREHNRLCGVVRAHEPTWTETQVFWKVRQVVAVEMQKIIYEEWLPELFGDQAEMLESGEFASFPQLREQMTAEFSLATYSMLPAQVGAFSLASLFVDPVQLLTDHGIGAFLQAAADTFAEELDAKVVDALRDVATLELARGRDVGLATYPDVVQCYGSTHIALYEQELSVGLLEEPTASAGSSLPLNMAIIVAEQFRRIRQFDPHFYTKLGSRFGAFYEQLVQGVTLGRLIRDNTALTGMRENVFQL